MRCSLPVDPAKLLQTLQKFRIVLAPPKHRSGLGPYSSPLSPLDGERGRVSRRVTWSLGNFFSLSPSGGEGRGGERQCPTTHSLTAGVTVLVKYARLRLGPFRRL